MQRIDYKKAIVLTGARQAGKTTLISAILDAINKPFLIINGDNPADRTLWSDADFELIKSLIAPFELIIFDEGQRITNLGLTVKMIVDPSLQKQVIITGSSALGLADTIQEPLTGRKWEFRIMPISWGEMVDSYSLAKTLPRLESFLIYGSYTDVIQSEYDKEEIVKSLSGSNLYMDILEMTSIRKPQLLVKLLQALVWQVGNEVSYNEIAQTIRADNETVISYIDLLEKSFVIFRLNPLAKNERKEIATSRKIYFYDNGVRNAIIDNFAPLAQRDDVGALWENYIISERVKFLTCNNIQQTKSYFWRNKLQAEIDYVETSESKYRAFKIKWNPKKQARFSKSFTDFYLSESTEVINSSNFWKYL
jgi:hypothetical protein